MSRSVHLVGSVPMASTDEVFVKVSEALGPYLKRLPDGETGQRLNWVGHLEKVFAANPALERTDEVFRIHPTATGWYRYRLKKGKRIETCAPATCSMPIMPWPLMRRSGGCRSRGRSRTKSWQCSSMSRQPSSHDCSEMKPPTTAAAGTKCRMSSALSSSISATTCRTEWSCCTTFATATTNTSTRSSRLTWGTWSNSRTACSRVKRSVQLVHMPVPRNRADEAYFRPLRRLELRPETELCLGLVHFTDGVEGAKRRLEAARRYVQDFSIAT